MKNSKLLKGLALLAVLTAAVACRQINKNGLRTEALDNSTWETAYWISAADAPVFTGRVTDGSRAADGASWFVSTVKNPRRVTEARWMATGLGVFELYVNGCPVGTEILKPGLRISSPIWTPFT